MLNLVFKRSGLKTQNYPIYDLKTTKFSINYPKITTKIENVIIINIKLR